MEDLEKTILNNLEQAIFKLGEISPELSDYLYENITIKDKKIQFNGNGFNFTHPWNRKTTLKDCEGCHNNIYNTDPKFSEKGCWHLNDSTIVKSQEIPIDVYPEKYDEYEFKDTPNCYKKKQTSFFELFSKGEYELETVWIDDSSLEYDGYLIKTLNPKRGELHPKINFNKLITHLVKKDLTSIFVKNEDPVPLCVFRNSELDELDLDIAYNKERNEIWIHVEWHTNFKAINRL